MIPINALQLALAKEKASVKLYRKMLVEHPGLKDLLLFLVNEEEKHVKMIENEIVKLMR
jgi:rubrerythrin